MLASRADKLWAGVILARRTDPQFKIHHACCVDPRLAHIAAAVSNEGNTGTLNIAPVLIESLKISQQLTGMKILRQGINHRYRGMLSHGTHPAMFARAHHDEIRHA